MTVQERFLRYVSFPTTSDPDSHSVPSTPGQLEFGAFLAQELRSIHMEDVRQDEFGYVYATLPASPGCELLEPVGFIAHMDTAAEVSGRDIRPKLVHYTGGDIPLESGEILQAARNPLLQQCLGHDLIVTDGTTLLGGDDKAGIAEIITACAQLSANPHIPRRRVAVCFTPDEEIGRGADRFRLEYFAASSAYTVDGGLMGEIEYDNFNAASAVVRIQGHNTHPGSAKGQMKNAALLATAFVSQLPPAQAPAHTQGREGFYHVQSIEATESAATVRLLIRDHEARGFSARKAFLQEVCRHLNYVWGEGTFCLQTEDSYYNMRDKVLAHPQLLRRAEAAYRSIGVEPRSLPIRGGTDGARLSYMGLPCPNLSTGGANAHSTHEFVSVQAMEQMVSVLVYLAGA